MQLRPKPMRRFALWLFLAPCLVALVAQIFIWVIPGCHPNPYGLGNCLVGSSNLAGALLVAQLGGIAAALALGLLVCLPLAAWSLSLEARNRRQGRHGA